MATGADFDADNLRPYRCGAFGTTTGRQCVLESDHDGPHQLEGEVPGHSPGHHENTTEDGK